MALSFGFKPRNVCVRDEKRVGIKPERLVAPPSVLQYLSVSK